MKLHKKRIVLNPKQLKRILPIIFLAVVLLLVYSLWPHSFPTPSEADSEMRVEKVNLGLEQIDNAQVKLFNQTERYEPYPGLERKLAALLTEYSCYRSFRIGGSLGTPREGYTLSMTYQSEDGQPVTINWGGGNLVRINDTIYRCPSGPVMMSAISDLLRDLKPTEVLTEDTNT